MQSVGHLLRQKRLAQGRSLEEVNFGTRISCRSLEAIEADQLDQFSSAFFYKSFVRQFAEFLKLDYSELAASVQAAADTLPAPRIPGQGGSTISVAAMPVRRKSSHRWIYSLVSLVLALAVCSTLYDKWQSSRFHLPALYKAVSTVQGSRLEISAPAYPRVAQGAEAAPAPYPTETASSAVPARVEVFRLEVSATEPTWLSLFADGKRSFTGTLEAAETKTLEGHETARIRTGNAGGVNVVFNGKLLGALGPRGQIRTAVFTKDGYQVLGSSVTAELTGFSSNGVAIRLQPALLHLF